MEKLTNAKQEVKLRRCKGIENDIAWRMRTNVPTRYLINPSRGFIQNDEPVTVIKILMYDISTNISYKT